MTDSDPRMYGNVEERRVPNGRSNLRSQLLIEDAAHSL